MAARETPATRAARAAQVAVTLHEYDHDGDAGAFGDEAAAKLGVDPARMFKPLVAESAAAGGGSVRLVVGLVPGASTLDLKALVAALGGKGAAMADPAAAERVTDRTPARPSAARGPLLVRGGISPLGQRKRLPTVFVSGGRRGLQLELAPADLVRLTGAVVAPLRRGSS